TPQVEADLDPAFDAAQLQGRRGAKQRQISLALETSPQGVVQAPGFDGRAELEQPRLVSGEVEPRTAVVPEYLHVVDRRDALGGDALPGADPLQERDARRGERVDPRVPLGRRLRRPLALNQGDLVPGLGERCGKARADDTATDDDNVEI